jgi:hypothetical protein
MNHLQRFEAILTHTAFITRGPEQLGQDPAAHRVIVNYQDFCMRIIGHLFFRFELEPPGYCICAALYEKVTRPAEKSDLMIGKESVRRYDSTSFSFMRFSLSLALLAAFFLASCAEEPPPPPRQHRAARYPATQAPAEYPPQQQPFNPNGPAQPTTTTAPPEVAASPPPAAAPPKVPSTKVAKGDYPYGIPVPGKPHLVESPYSPGKYIDVEGFPPGTEVKDPYTDKIFLVP